MTHPTYSLIIPAYNEAAQLPATLDAARQAMAAVEASGELIVVDNNSADDTAAVARACGAIVAFEPYNQISRARNAGGRAARGAGLVFVDADTQINGPLLRDAVELMRRGDVVGGGARVVFDREVVWPARLALGMWNLYSRWKREAAGCFLFCTRESFEAVGGFSERVYASEEIWFCKAIKRWARSKGQRFEILPDPPVVTAARKVSRPWQTAGSMCLMLLFPAAVFFRPLCGFWYKRDSPA